MRLAPPGAAFSTDPFREPHRPPRRRWRIAALPLVLLLAVGAAGCGTSTTTRVAVPTATKLSVTLTTDFATYSVSQAIGVTVTNAGQRALYAVDNHTECTVLQLQEQVRGVWTTIMPCDTGQPVNVLEVAPGPGVPYTLAPGNAPGNPNAWDPGVYRVALLLGNTADGSDLTTAAYSAGFVIEAS